VSATSATLLQLIGKKFSGHRLFFQESAGIFLKKLYSFVHASH